jgi:diadenosine tetraphosphate (Ap4A) HIT family hydrolase
MPCKLCNITRDRLLLKTLKLYEDEKVVAVLSKKPASICHVIVFPKVHCTILEQVPDDIAAHILNVCNKISRAIFESLNVQGTNIFIQNGVAAGQEEPHFIAHIIARTENDGIKLDWEPRKLTEEEMSTIELSYKQHTEGIVFNAEGAKREETKEIKERVQKIGEEDEENYMIKYFNKMP